MEDLPTQLRRNSLDYYYLSVWPGLMDLDPAEQVRLPARPSVTNYAYFHIPFCSGLCDFCSYFLAVVGDTANDARTGRYLADLLKQVENAALTTRLELSYLYLGGGTPSLLSPDQLHHLLHGLEKLEALAPSVLGTMELHPEVFRDKKRLNELLAILSDYGLKRVSIGYQSDSEELLEANNRRHESDFLTAAVELLHGKDFLVNVDLMYGLPDQSLLSWVRSVAATIAVEPDSISTYFTFITFGTRLRRRVDAGGIATSPHQLLQTQHIASNLALEEAGFHELPGDFYSKPHGDPATYVQDSLPSDSNSLALGAGAYGYYPGVQYFNYFGFHDYGAAVNAGVEPIWRAKLLSPQEELARDVMFSFKNAPALRRDLFRAKHSVDPMNAYPEQFRALKQQGLLTEDLGELRLTRKGRLVVEEITCLFIPPDVDRAPRAGVANKVRRHHFAPTYGKAER